MTTSHEIVCDWTVVRRTTYRFALSELVKKFPDEYQEARANGLSDREFVEDAIDLGGVDAAMQIVEDDSDYEWSWR